jgi:hypothetical protein
MLNRKTRLNTENYKNKQRKAKKIRRGKKGIMNLKYWNVQKEKKIGMQTEFWNSVCIPLHTRHHVKQSMLCCRITTSPRMKTQILIK